MKYISHRGNISGPNSKLENTIPYIETAITRGFDVEIDLFFQHDKFYLGHDSPENFVTREYLFTYNDYLWCHAKTINTLYELLKLEVNCFFHETDQATLTSNGIIWTFPEKEVTDKSVIVNNNEIIKEFPIKIYGICSDYIEEWRTQCLTKKI